MPKNCTNLVCEESTEMDDPSKACRFAEKCASACQAYGRVCPCAAKAAARAACKAIEELSKDSKIFQNKSEIEELDADDLVIGKKLGEGGFSVVNEVDVKGNTLAVKYLRREVMVERHAFEHGASDLAIEANFLARLNHKNIVKIHGVTAGSVETNVASGKECGFFILIDRLHGTLEKKIEDWKVDAEKYRGKKFAILSAEKKEKRRQALTERLKVATQIVDALQYLHGLNIIYRDLKPDNIGFAEDGTLKLFDFGLAKELKLADQQTGEVYKLTGNTGSRRYMSPEVAKETAYGLSVDVYSFAILLWEVCALEKPFYGYSPGVHMKQVVMGGERPKLDSPNTSWWPMNLQWLLKKCWSPFAVNRPSLEVIKETLQYIVDGSDALPKSAADETSKPVMEPPKGGFARMMPARMASKRNQTEARKGPVRSLSSGPRNKRSQTTGGLPRSISMRWRRGTSGGSR